MENNDKKETRDNYDDYKAAFFIDSDKEFNLIDSFIKYGMQINSLNGVFCGRDVIYVPSEEYERVLLYGKKFITSNNFDNTRWVNYYDEVRNCYYIDIAYAIVNPFDSEVKAKMDYVRDFMYGVSDDSTPKELFSYFKDMSNYLKVERIARNRNRIDNALLLQPLSNDYERMYKLTRDFIEKEGYGPFKTIYPVSFDGEVKKEEYPILAKRK